MNRIYRNVWNEVTRTYVAAAEIVRGRGKRSKSSATAQASEAAISAVNPEGLMAAIARAQAQAQSAATQAQRRLRGALPRPMLLEQRFMFDGAALVDGVDTVSKALDAADTGTKTVDKTIHLDIVAPAGVTVSDTVRTAKAEAEKLVADFLARSDAKEQLFALFNGGKTTPDAAWNAAFDQLMAEIQSGGDSIRVELRSEVEMQGAFGAFSVSGTDGQRVIYLNTDWAAGAGEQAVASVLVEEMGHAFDAKLNAGGDTAGDEGERFSLNLFTGHGPMDSVLTDDDHAQLRFEGRNVDVEMASFTFPNGATAVGAYEMVYDLDNSGSVEGNRGETAAEKEQNSHNFLRVSDIKSVVINDSQSAREFSGNDVSVTATFTKTDNTTFVLHGWVSRPIKVGGVVKGFYFWTDSSFTTLQIAQTDGNNDGDRSTGDNRGFLFVVDQSHFNSLTSSTVNGAANIFNIGSSSDRVDAALNALLPAQVPPVANDDTTTGTPDAAVAGRPALEQGFNSNTSTVVTATVNATGNVITNDTGGNGTLRVTNVTASAGPSSAVSSGTAGVVTGNYGNLTLNANGAYSYVVSNSLLPVDMLLSGTVNDAFTYTIGDGAGGTASATLTITINGSNDAPVAANDYNIAKETTTGTGAVTGFSATGVVASGTHVLANDTDVDTGDTKTVTGVEVKGNATSTSIAPVVGTATLTFTVTNNNIKTGDPLYVRISGTYFLVVTSDQTTPVKSANTGGTSLQGIPAGYRLANGTYQDFGTTISSFFTTNPNTAFNGANNLGNNPPYTFVPGSNEITTVSSAQTSSYTDVTNLSSISGTIAVGMTVSGGTGVPLGTKVSNITLTNGVITSVRLDQALTSTAGGAFTFTGASGVAQTLQGAHGTLTLNSDGSYTYTPTQDNPRLSVGESAVEVFDYTMRDTAGLTSAAKLFITVYGTGTNDPVPNNDTGSATESGVQNNASPYTGEYTNTAAAGSNATGNVLSNDQERSSTAAGTFTNNGVVKSIVREGSGLAVTGVDTDNLRSTSQSGTVAGLYGSLTISDLGAYTYTVDDNNTTVNALQVGSSLTESFLYRITNSLSPAGSSWARLTITINGTNDAPSAATDGVTAYAGSPAATGNVLSNDTDPDTGDTLTVAKAQKGGTVSGSLNNVPDNSTSTTTGANAPLSIAGDFGTLKIGADGTYTYTVDESFNAVKALLATGDSLTDTFTYQVRDARGAFATHQLVVTVRGQNDAPVNSFGGTAFSSTAQTGITTAMNTAVTFSAGGAGVLSVADVDSNLSSIVVAVENGTLDFTSTPSNVTLSASSGSTITISGGTQAQLNAALALLRYTPTTSYVGTDFLTINSVDALGARDIDGLAINIPKNSTATVSEAGLSTGRTPTADTEYASGSATSQSVSLGLPSGQTVQAQQTGTVTDGGNSVGSWTVNTDGSFQFTLTGAANHTSGAVTKTFSYTAYDSYGNAVTNKVTVTINDDSAVAVADAGSVTEDASPNTVTGNVITGTDSASADTTSADTPVTVAGVAAGSTSTNLDSSSTVGASITGTYGAISIDNTGAYTYTLNNANTTVQALNSGQTLTDTFTYTIKDADGSLSNTTVTITINGADEAPSLAINDVTVNEAAGTMTFTVTRTGSTASSSTVDYSFTAGTANTGGSGAANDYSATAGSLTFAAGDTSEQVVVTINNDGVYEGSEAFTVNLTNASGATISDASGTGTIKDDGTGGDDDGDNTDDATDTNKNDDRPTISVTDRTVNEAAGTLTFAVSLSNATTQALTFTPTLTDGTATVGTDTGASSALEYWNGTNWVSASSGVSIAAGATSVQVRTQVTNDATYEGSEFFSLSTGAVTVGSSNTAAALTNQAGASGTGTIKDDGTGGDDDGDNTDDTTDTNKNDDRAIAVTAYGPVNEASTYAMFTVDAIQGYELDLAVQAASSGSAAAFAGFTTIQFSTDGSNWSTFTNVNKPTVPAGGKVYVRVDITSEQDSPGVFEGAETFALKASYVTNTAKSATGDTSIVDDGSGKKYGPDVVPGTGPNESTSGLDDDRDPRVNSITVNEGSDWAVFEVSTVTGCQITGFDVVSGTANVTRIDNQSIQYWDDSPNVNNWVSTTTSGMTISLVGGSKTLVRVNIDQEDDSNFEGSESFQLKVLSNNLSATVYGTANIVDDGTGTKFPDQTPTTGPAPVTDPNNLDDDRTIDVVGGMTFNEASTYATFTVTANKGQNIVLKLNDSASDTATITGFTYQYSTDGGTTWLPATPAAYNADTTLTVPGTSGTGTANVLVRVNISSEADTGFEGAEAFTLTASYANNSAKTDTDTNTITDDGTGRKDMDGDGDITDSGDGNGATDGPFDDDRTIDVVGGMTFNEASTYATFTVTANKGQNIVLKLNDSASDTATITGFTYQYSTDGGTTWLPATPAAYNADTTLTVPGTSGTGTANVLVRVNISSEADTGFEGAEAFTLTASYANNSAKTDTDTNTITDDGTGRKDMDGDGDITDSGDGNGATDGPFDDDRTIDVVGGMTFNEASTYATFTVTANKGQNIVLKLNDSASDTATITGFTYQYSTDGGTTWLPATPAAYNADTTLTVPGTSGTGTANVLVRVNISSEADTGFEGAEAFTLTASYANNSAKTDTDTNTITDDGTGRKDMDGDGDITDSGDGNGATDGPFDDDRTIDVVGGMTFNEASTYATFTVTANKGQNIVLKLNDSASDTATITGFTYQYSTDGGTTWLPATPAAYNADTTLTVPGTSGTGTANVLVRVNISSEADTGFEGAEAFTLTASYANNSAKTDTDTNTITDDGTGRKDMDGDGDITDSGDGNGATDGPFDDDRTIDVVGGMTFNEASTYATFTVTANKGQNIVLKLNDSASDTATITGFTYQYSTDGGTTWLPATPAAYNADTTLTVPGTSGTGTANVLVRVNISSEADTGFEGAEAFTLTASYANNSAKTDTDTNTITDDGTGRKDMDGDGDITDSGDGNGATDGPFDDDRTIDVVGGMTFNEASTYATFTVTANKGQNIVLKLNDSASDTATITGFTYQYSTDGGTTWLPATPAAYNADTTLTVPGTSGTGTANVLVRVNIISETDTELEGAETFTLTASYANNSAKTDTDSNTVNDDADVDGITTYVESVLAKRANGDANPAAEPFNGDLNGDVPTSLGDGFQNAVTTFSWINNVYFDAANADPLTVDAKSIVTLVAEDTASSNGEPDPAIQLRNVVVPALTAEQQSALQTYLRFTPGWTPLGFSAQIRPEAQPAVTNIDHDANRTGNQWRFTVDISRSGETEDTFMGFIKWVDQATIDAYVAADVPLLDLSGDAITAPGWVDFTRLSANGDGVSIGQTEDGSILFLDYIITDNAFGDLDLREGYITDPGIPIFVVRTIEVTGKEDVAEGSNAVFTVSLNAPKSLPTEIALQLSDDTGGTDSSNGQPLDYSSLMTVYYFDAQGMKQSLTVTEGKITLPAKVTEFFVSVTTTEDAEYEGGESFSLTATLPEGTADSGSTTIVDDGSGTVYDERGEPDPTATPTDDRPLSVNDIEISESSPYGVFKVTGASGQLVKLALVSGTATLENGDGSNLADGSEDFGPGLEYFNGASWQTYTPGSFVAIPEGSTTLLVRVPIVNDTVLERQETFQLIATNTGGTASAPGTATVYDNGTNGQRFEASNTSGDPTDGPPNDDTPIPPTEPQNDQALSELVAEATETASVATPVEFNLPAVDAVAVADVVTSSSGFPITVVEGSQPNLVVFNGITDQFVEARGVQTVQLPADAFAHTRSDAVITLIAQLSDGSPLPPNILFNSQAGTFQVTPRPGIFEELEITVIARDAEGREAATKFKLNIGEAAKPTSSLSRPALTELLRNASVKQRDGAFSKFLQDLQVGQGKAGTLERGLGADKLAAPAREANLKAAAEAPVGKAARGATAKPLVVKG